VSTIDSLRRKQDTTSSRCAFYFYLLKAPDGSKTLDLRVPVRDFEWRIGSAELRVVVDHNRNMYMLCLNRFCKVRFMQLVELREERDLPMSHGIINDHMSSKMK